MGAKRTPGPWRITAGFLTAPMSPGDEKSPHIPMYEMERIVGRKTDDEADRAFIVRACNAHDDLVTQLKGVIAAFRCVISSLDIDEDETTLNISAGGRAVAQVPIATLLANANEALAKAEAQP